ncbi:DUF3299 domain-containing protein [Candidatus Njordibacter sp. Uisw_039]|jgi:hypothetical protein|uniref:DUF3299 domain-containing protein n=1 Tax=Candidatus Njordibacter sp. Uisw_039 TaxID=3230972 RepID=UPI003A2C699B|tara:strand:- start:435 stop:1007 length:573 start_codon:yes stop_codon:yes gene_type:complete
MKSINVAYKPLLLVILLSCFSWSGAFAADANEIDWESLIPQDWNPNQVFEDMTDEQYYALSDSELMILEQTVQAMFDAAPVVDAFDGQQVKIPGFVLPLEFNSTLLKEFLLVPYFGACTHTPPPPANQIIYGKLETGSKLESIYLPVWITGTLNVSRVQSELNESGIANGVEVQSAYSMDVELIEPYLDQ